MAENDTDRTDEYEAEREAEIEDELERLGRDPDEVDGALGTQNAPRADADDFEEDRDGAAEREDE